MKKSQLKSIIKECVREVLLEEAGVMSHLVAEVARGLSAPVLVREEKKMFSGVDTAAELMNSRSTNGETRKKLLEAVGAEAYGGIDLFEGTTPINKAGTEGREVQAPSSLGDIDPSDPGIDITGIMNVGSAQNWNKLVNG